MDGSVAEQRRRLASARAILRTVEASENIRPSHVRQGWGHSAPLSVPAGVYHVDGCLESLTYALVKTVTEDRWAAVAGLPDIGWEAAFQMGLDPNRVVVVPSLQQEPARAVGLLVEGFEVVAVGDVPLTPTGRQALAARVRKTGSSLLLLSHWAGVSRPFPLVARSWIPSGVGLGVIEGGVAV